MINRVTSVSLLRKQKLDIYVKALNQLIGSRDFSTGRECTLQCIPDPKLTPPIQSRINRERNGEEFTRNDRTTTIRRWWQQNGSEDSRPRNYSMKVIDFPLVSLLYSSSYVKVRRGQSDSDKDGGRREKRRWLWGMHLRPFSWHEKISVRSPGRRFQRPASIVRDGESNHGFILCAPSDSSVSTCRWHNPKTTCC